MKITIWKDRISFKGKARDLKRLRAFTIRKRFKVKGVTTWVI